MRRTLVFTVDGYTGTLAQLARRFSDTTYSNVHQRLTKYRWTLEQSLGLAPPPARARPSRSVGVAQPARRGSAFDNLMAAARGEISAEEYLLREGVGSNGYMLPTYGSVRR